MNHQIHDGGRAANRSGAAAPAHLCHLPWVLIVEVLPLMTGSVRPNAAGGSPRPRSAEVLDTGYGRSGPGPSKEAAHRPKGRRRNRPEPWLACNGDDDTHARNYLH